MTQKNKMLNLVLSDPELQEKYNFSNEDYDDIYDAINSNNAIIATVARIIVELNGSVEESTQKKVYKTIFNHLNNNLLI